MSKKYVPSGYQIINLDLSDKTNGTAFIPETEDEILLLNLLVNGVIPSKPILMNIHTDNTDMVGFVVYDGSTSSIIMKGSSYDQVFSESSSKLLWVETEL